MAAETEPRSSDAIMQSLIRLLVQTLIPAVAAVSGSQAIEAFLLPPEPRQDPLVCAYVLPFPAYLGEVSLSQGNRSTAHWGSHQVGSSSQFAFDFDLQAGEPVLAARDGIVVDLQYGETACGDKKYIDNANYVIVAHEDGTYAQYTHLAPNLAVGLGQSVVAGRTRLGSAGNSGWTNCEDSPGGGVHLHFQAQEGISKSSRSLAACFLDVPGDGIPIAGSAYASQNR